MLPTSQNKTFLQQVKAMLPTNQNKTFLVGLTRGSSMLFNLMSLMMVVMMIMMLLMMVVVVPGIGKLNKCAASVSPIPHASLHQQ